MTNKVIHTLSKMVAMPTVSHRPLTALAAFLAQRSEDAGFRVHRFDTSPGKSNVVAIAGPDKPGGLVISGHMDVVPVDGQDWSSDPFVLRETSGRLHGRGACDMKGFIAAVIEATDSSLISQLQRPLALVWTHDEEVGCLGSAALESQIKDLPQPLPSLAWIGEPTDFQVCNLHPGHARVDIHCTGKPAHSSRPILGLNAISMARGVIEALENLQREWASETAFEDQLDTPWTILNVAEIRGGSAINIVPEHCQIHLGVRPLPGQTIDSILRRIHSALTPAMLRAQREGGQITVVGGPSTPSLWTDPCCALMPTLLQHSDQKQPVGVPFATDGGNLNRLGMETLVFGPGSIDQAHRADEYIPTEQLQKTVRLVQEVVYHHCGD